MDEVLWKAITRCDPHYDGKFFYGVDTTGVFCRPSCKSRNPKRENVRIFLTINEAVSANFRPCKRCSPDHLRWPNEDLTHHVVELIESRYQESLTLPKLADMLHMSPYHLHRTFKRVTGQTPAQFLKNTRLKTAKHLLAETDKTISDVAVAAGFPNTAHFSTAFLKQYGLTPSAYRCQHTPNFTLGR